MQQTDLLGFAINRYHLRESLDHRWYRFITLMIHITCLSIVDTSLIWTNKNRAINWTAAPLQQFCELLLHSSTPAAVLWVTIAQQRHYGSSVSYYCTAAPLRQFCELLFYRSATAAVLWVTVAQQRHCGSFVSYYFTEAPLRQFCELSYPRICC